MDDATRELLRSKTSATDAAIASKNAADARNAQAEREANQRAEDAERNLQNTAERIQNNWLQPLAVAFAREVRAAEIDSTGNSPHGPGFIENSRRKVVRIRGFNGSYGNELRIGIEVQSESRLRAWVDSSSVRQTPNDETTFDLILNGQLLSLADEAAATLWANVALVEKYDAQRKVAAGLG